MSTFNFSPTVLKWAANNINISWEDLADEIITAKTKRKERLEAAYKGILTIRQAEKVSKKTNTPFGFLFLDTPPEIENRSLPDLRTTSKSTPLSNDFYETLEDIYKKIDWYKELLQSEGELEKLSFVKKFTLTNTLSPPEVAKDIQDTIEIPHDFFKECNRTNYYNALVNKIENIGVFVFTNGVVKNNPRRKLNTEEFRGFAIADKYVPAVFVNNADSLSAQIFTLIHEIAHIWIGESGISDLSDHNNIESFCNKVSAEFLMPTKLFTKKWNQEFNKTSVYETISSIADYFKVSVFAAAIKAKNLNLIKQTTVNDIKMESIRIYRMRKKGSGGNFYATLPLRNSKRLSKIIVNQAVSRKILLRDAASMLNAKPDTVMQLYLRREEKR